MIKKMLLKIANEWYRDQFNFCLLNSVLILNVKTDI